MPEYLAPGVYVEETSFRNKPIEGVSTSTTGMIGPSRDGPLYTEPPLLTSYQEFSDIYGGMDPLDYAGNTFTNFLAQAVRSYFEEGGSRLYVARTFNQIDGDPNDPPTQTGGLWSDGRARWSIDDDSSVPGTPPNRLTVEARYPGAISNRLVSFTFRLTPSILADGTLRGVNRFEVVWVQTTAEATAQTAGQMYWVDTYPDSLGRRQFRLRRDDPDDPPTGAIVDLSTLAQVRIVTVSIESESSDQFRGRFDLPKTYEDLTFHPGELGPNARRSLLEEFTRTPARRSTELYVPIVIDTALGNGVDVAELLAQRQNSNGSSTVLEALADEVLGGRLDNESTPERTVTVTDDMRTTIVELAGGSDGLRPGAGHYAGIEDPSDSGGKSGLLALEDLEDISIIAAPGSSFAGLNGYGTQMRTITGQLLSHCERMRYRVAVLDSPNGALPGEIRDGRASLDSKYGALYYPWVRSFDPITETDRYFPPSGFVTGIYARNDVNRGVHKAPANEVVRMATGFEILLNKGQQELLNPLGINCLRFFEGRGMRVWGARAITSDPEWRYINLRRNFSYLGRSIELGTQWAVFEPNSEELWANVRRAVEDFLYNEWKNTRLMGTSPDEAYFVRCDRTTMTQADIDSGRLICLVGVALLRPAEFVIFRIGQKTIEFDG